MKKVLLILFITTSVFSISKNNDTVNLFKQYENEKTDLKIFNLDKKIEETKKENELLKEQLNKFYQIAEYRISTDREELKNDLIRAKIYWYYHDGYRRYYYYDIDWNIIYIN